MVVGRGPTLDSRSDADAGLTRKRIHSQVKMEAFASLNASVFNFWLRISACGSSHARYDNDMALAQAFVKGSSHQQHHTLGTYRKQDGGDASATLASRSFLGFCLLTTRTRRRKTAFKAFNSIGHDGHDASFRQSFFKRD